jgi:carbamoyl-phosphate synthase large subunit
MQNIPYYTTMDGAQAALEAIEAQRAGAPEVRPLQAYYESLKA